MKNSKKKVKELDQRYGPHLVCISEQEYALSRSPGGKNGV